MSQLKGLELTEQSVESLEKVGRIRGTQVEDEGEREAKEKQVGGTSRHLLGIVGGDSQDLRPREKEGVEPIHPTVMPAIISCFETRSGHTHVFFIYSSEEIRLLAVSRTFCHAEIGFGTTIEGVVLPYGPP